MATELSLSLNLNFSTNEFVNKLKSQMESAGFEKTLVSQLFNILKMNCHLVALDKLAQATQNSADATISNIDLIFRWLSVRFFDNRPAIINKKIEFIKALLSMLSSLKYNLSDYEAKYLVLYIISHFGDITHATRKSFQEILKQITKVYKPAKVIKFLVDGLVSNSVLQRTKCLEEIGQMIKEYGWKAFCETITLKEIAKQIEIEMMVLKMQL